MIPGSSSVGTDVARERRRSRRGRRSRRRRLRRTTTPCSARARRWQHWKVRCPTPRRRSWRTRTVDLGGADWCRGYVPTAGPTAQILPALALKRAFVPGSGCVRLLQETAATPSHRATEEERPVWYHKVTRSSRPTTRKARPSRAGRSGWQRAAGCHSGPWCSGLKRD